MGELDPPAPRYLAAGLSEKGRRDSNEDAAVLAVLAPPSALRAFAVLSDGMGGHNAGEVASRMTIEILRAKVQAFAARPGAGALPGGEIEAEVRGWIEEVNRTIYDRGKASAEQKGMGATVALVLALADGRLVAANVGDSRIFLVSGLGVRQVSVDHTAIAEQRRAFGSDSVAPEDDSGNPFAHALTKSLGQEKTIDPSVRTDLTLGVGDVVLLTTDGVTDVLEAERFLTALETSATLQAAAGEIHRLAFEAGSKDNISVALVSNGPPASLGTAKKERTEAKEASPPAAAPEEPEGVTDEEVDEGVLVAGAAFGPSDALAPSPPRRGRVAAIVLAALFVTAAAAALVFTLRKNPSKGELAASAGPGAGPPATTVASAPPAPISPAPLPTPDPSSPSKEYTVASAPAEPASASPPAAAQGGAAASTAAPAAARPAPRAAKGPAEPSFREPSALAGLKPLEYPPTATETPTATPTPVPTQTPTETPTPVVSPAPAKPGAAKPKT